MFADCSTVIAVKADIGQYFVIRLMVPYLMFRARRSNSAKSGAQSGGSLGSRDSAVVMEVRERGRGPVQTGRGRGACAALESGGPCLACAPPPPAKKGGERENVAFQLSEKNA